MVIQSNAADSEAKSAYTPVFPALRAQHRSMRTWLLDGMASRRELLMWAHACAVVAVGRVPNQWFPDLVNDRWTVAACLRDQDDREQLTDSAPNEERARSVRMDIISETLSPAFQSALAELRNHAGDYVEESGGLSHVERQRHIALRPRLSQLAEEQHTALQWPFGMGERDPLTSRADVIEWADYVGYSCAGGLANDWAQRVASPLGEWWGPLTDGRDAMLETLLAAEILPEMCRALRRAGRDSEEMGEPRPIEGGNGGIS